MDAPADIAVSLDCLKPQAVSYSSSEKPLWRYPADLRVSGRLFDTFHEALDQARKTRERIEALDDLEGVEELARIVAEAVETLDGADPYLKSCVELLRERLTTLDETRSRRMALC